METGFCDNSLYHSLLITDDDCLADARTAICQKPKRDNLFIDHTPDAGGYKSLTGDTLAIRGDGCAFGNKLPICFGDQTNVR